MSVVSDEAKARFLATLEIARRELKLHEHMTNAEELAADIRAASDFVAMFHQTYAAFLRLGHERFGVNEEQLSAYLTPSTISSSLSARS